MARQSPVNGSSNATDGKSIESLKDATSTDDLPEKLDKHCSVKCTTEKPRKNNGLIYGIDDKPGWCSSAILGLQHCFLSIGGIIGIPLIIATSLCMPEDEVGYVGRAKLLNSLFFVSGIMTVLQTTFGSRLPILQGASFTFLPSVFAVLSLPQNQCPAGPVSTNLTNGLILYNDTDGMLVDGSELWMRRMRHIQGALAVASVFEVVMGASGALGFLMKFIGPMTVAPALALVGLSLFKAATQHAASQWGIAFFTVIVLVIVSQYLQNFNLPFPSYTRKKGCHILKTEFTKMFPVLITIALAWLLCLILTQSSSLPDDSREYGYWARTDARASVLKSSTWFYFPYPGQWGLPVVSGAGVIAMIAAVFAGMIESVGDYYACSRLCEVSPLPKHAMNRGLMMEGIGCIICGVIGVGCGMTSYSENIGALGITRVASRRVLQAASLLLLIFGVLGKVGAVFVLIPDPIIGGIFFVMFGMITSVGLANLQHVDLNSPRNVFIIGFSLFTGLTAPMWVKENPEAINTGIEWIDQTLLVLTQTSIIVGGVIAAFLDNTLPGTPEERGIISWNSGNVPSSADLSEDEIKTHEKRLANCYALPFSTNFRFSKYVPFLPEYGGK